MKTILLAAALLAPIAHADEPWYVTQQKQLDDAPRSEQIKRHEDGSIDVEATLKESYREDLKMLWEMTRGPAYRRYVPSLEARVTDLENLHN